MMTKQLTELELFASKLNGREYLNEMTEKEEQEAKDKGFLVIFGQSDDLMEARGVIYDEFGISRPYPCFIHFGEKDSIIGYASKLKGYVNYEALLLMLKDFNVPLLKVCVEEYGIRSALEGEFGWNYSTDAPHATFDILEDGENYCKGLVIDLKGYFSNLRKETE